MTRTLADVDEAGEPVTPLRRMMGCLLLFCMAGCSAGSQTASRERTGQSATSDKARPAESAASDKTRSVESATSDKARKTVERKFSGTIRRIHFGVCVDGTNYIVIDNKQVVFASAGRHQDPEEATWGRMIGFIFPESVCDDFKGYDGKRAEALAAEHFAFGAKGGPLPFYTLYGNEKYYVKLLP